MEQERVREHGGEQGRPVHVVGMEQRDRGGDEEPGRRPAAAQRPDVFVAVAEKIGRAVEAGLAEVIHDHERGRLGPTPENFIHKLLREQHRVRDARGFPFLA